MSLISIITNYTMSLISNILCLFLDQFYYTFTFFSSFLGMGNDFLNFLIFLYFGFTFQSPLMEIRCPCVLLLIRFPLMEMPCPCVSLMIVLAETLAASCLCC